MIEGTPIPWPFVEMPQLAESLDNACSETRRSIRRSASTVGQADSSTAVAVAGTPVDTPCKVCGVPLTLRRSNSVIGFVSRQVRQVMGAAEAASSNATLRTGLEATISDIEHMVYSGPCGSLNRGSAGHQRSEERSP